MKKIILNLAVTLDGFIEGPNGEVDWCRIDEDTDSGLFFDKFLDEIDTIFYGRITYDLWGQYQPPENALPGEKKIWQAVHSKKKYVFSRSLKTDNKAKYVSGDIPDAANNIKNQPGKNIWLYGGANLITEFINSGIVDKYLLAIFPVILGSGKPLFSNIQNRAGLKLNSVQDSKSGVIVVDYDAKKLA